MAVWGRGFQAEVAASEKALRWMHFHWIQGMVRRPERGVSEGEVRRVVQRGNRGVGSANYAWLHGPL